MAGSEGDRKLQLFHPSGGCRLPAIEAPNLLERSEHDDNPGNKVADDHGKSDSLAEEAGDTGGEEQYCEILNKIEALHVGAMVEVLL